MVTGKYISQTGMDGNNVAQNKQSENTSTVSKKCSCSETVSMTIKSEAFLRILEIFAYVLMIIYFGRAIKNNQ